MMNPSRMECRRRLPLGPVLSVWVPGQCSLAYPISQTLGSVHSISCSSQHVYTYSIGTSCTVQIMMSLLLDTYGIFHLVPSNCM